MQNDNPKKPAQKLSWLPALLLVCGLILIVAQFYGNYTLVVNGSARKARAIAFNSGQLLRAAGYVLMPEDEIFPAENKLNLLDRTIVLNQARLVTIQVGEDKKNNFFRELAASEPVGTSADTFLPRGFAVVEWRAT